MTTNDIEYGMGGQSVFFPNRKRQFERIGAPAKQKDSVLGTMGACCAVSTAVIIAGFVITWAFAIAMTVGYVHHSDDLLENTKHSERSFVEDILLYDVIMLWSVPILFLIWKHTGGANERITFVVGLIGLILNSIAVNKVVKDDNDNHDLFPYLVMALVYWTLPVITFCCSKQSSNK